MEKKVNISLISTESRNERTKNIDKLNTREILSLLNSEDQTVPLAVEKVIDEIKSLTDAAFETIKNGGRLFYIGAGTSGRLGVLDASEMPPTYNVSKNVIIGIIAGGDEALRNPIEGAEDSKELVIEDLKSYNFDKSDMLVGIAASGRTPYVISGLNYANSIGAKTGSISTSSNSEIGKISKFPVDAVTGPEPITGSTRMKSGTAQKLILNMISTTIMVKWGKVYQNWMVDVAPTNEKLVERAISIVINITGEDREFVISKLEQCNYSPKHAVVMIVKNVTYEESIQLLKNNNDKLAEVIND